MTARATILCVDDESAVSNQLSAQLTRAFSKSHDVECAQSAEEALALIEDVVAAGGSVPLVICDQVMPGMKGDRFLETVHRRRPAIKKILLTGQAGLESAIYAINNAGLDRYLEKPWEPADLQRTVENLLRQHDLEREVADKTERLAQRGRDLHALFDVVLRLGSSEDPDRILALVAETACKLQPAGLSLFARAQPRREPRFWMLPDARLKQDLTTRLDAALRAGEASPRLPDEVVGLPLQHAATLFGFLVAERAGSARDTLALLSILAGHAAAALNNRALLDERVESERLSTVGRMIATIVHDFRSPMSAIKGYAELIEETELAPERRRESAHLIGEEVDRMNAMAEEILEFTRGRVIALNAAETTVADLVAKLQGLTAPEFEEKQLRFLTDLRYTGRVVLDVDRIKRALLNVVSNAVDAMAPGGTFTLAAQLQSGQLELTLADDGHGIPEDVLPRVFEPFFTHGKPHGIGVGMAIAKRIVEDHGGTIRAERRGSGGSSFMVRLPIEPARRG